MPRGADPVLRVTGVEQSEQFLPSVLVESFFGHGEQAPRPIERNILVTPVAKDLVRLISKDELGNKTQRRSKSPRNPGCFTALQEEYVRERQQTR